MELAKDRRCITFGGKPVFSAPDSRKLFHVSFSVDRQYAAVSAASDGPTYILWLQEYGAARILGELQPFRDYTDQIVAEFVHKAGAPPRLLFHDCASTITTYSLPELTALWHNKIPYEYISVWRPLPGQGAPADRVAYAAFWIWGFSGEFCRIIDMYKLAYEANAAEEDWYSCTWEVEMRDTPDRTGITEWNGTPDEDAFEDGEAPAVLQYFPEEKLARLDLVRHQTQRYTRHAPWAWAVYRACLVLHNASFP